jgi:hypothetical protein
MLLRWMMEGKISVGTVDLLTVLMIVLLSLDGRLVAASKYEFLRRDISVRSGPWAHSLS